MDFVIFKIAATIRNKPVTYVRILLASCLASALYCMGIIVPGLQRLPGWMYNFVVPIIPILFLFEWESYKGFIKHFIICHVTAWAIGGLAFNFYYMFAKANQMGTASIMLPIGAALVLLVCTEMGFSWIRKRLICPRFEYDLLLSNEGKSVELQGFLDTGNSLYTINHRPVILVSFKEIKTILSEDYITLLEACENGNLLEELSRSKPGVKTYLIPFKSVGCREGIIVGVPIEKILLIKGSCKATVKNCVVGICYHNLFKNQYYSALIHPDLVALT